MKLKKKERMKLKKDPASIQAHVDNSYLLIYTDVNKLKKINCFFFFFNQTPQIEFNEI